MATYQSNTDVTDGEIITSPVWTVRNGAVYTETLSSPTPVERSYEPTVTGSWRILPAQEESLTKVKQQRLIKMTPLDVGRVQSDYFVASRPRNIWRGYAYSSYESPQPPCPTPPAAWYNGKSTLHVAYEENFTLSDLLARDVPHYQVDTDQAEAVGKMLNDSSASVVDALHGSWDALTELAEFPEAMRMLLDILRAARDPLKGIADLKKRYAKARTRGKTHREALDDLSSLWLSYRYGIMPLVYSIVDIITLLEQKGAEFKTERVSETLTLDESTRFGLLRPNEYLYDICRGEIRVNAVGKMRYGEDSSRLSDQININLFKTAWELIPFSFVIDWFVNVGDVLSAHTSSLYSSAIERQFCRSVRSTYSLRTYYRGDYVDSYYNYAAPYNIVYYCYGSPNTMLVRGAETWDFSIPNSVDAIVRKISASTYKRVLFNPTDATFNFKPSLSWLRGLDAIALSLKMVGLKDL